IAYTSAKTQFSAVCSADGRITVVADLSLTITSEGVPSRINLVDRNCRPKEMDGSRALFSFPINSCGSTVELGKESVTYKNEIFFSKELNAPTVSRNDFDRVTIQCTYALAGLLSVYRFQSDTAGVGHICILHTPLKVYWVQLQCKFCPLKDCIPLDRQCLQS
ncbi:hypothetical protein FQN60_016039, partial [Etheostoma spectabile]